MSAALPDVGEVIAPVLAQVPRERQPLLIALAERMAAERYRGWAGQVEGAAERAQLLACAAREEEIAAVAAEFFPAERQSVVILGPDGNAKGER